MRTAMELICLLATGVITVWFVVAMRTQPPWGVVLDPGGVTPAGLIRGSNAASWDHSQP